MHVLKIPVAQQRVWRSAQVANRCSRVQCYLEYRDEGDPFVLFNAGVYDVACSFKLVYRGPLHGLQPEICLSLVLCASSRVLACECVHTHTHTQLSLFGGAVC